eukprot:4659995-Pyramimonas_sp.AAC.1
MTCCGWRRLLTGTLDCVETGQGHIRGPMRGAIEDLDMQVMRMRCCHFGLKYDRLSKLSSRSCLKVATTCTRIPTNLWRCTCQTSGTRAQLTDHELDRRGQGAQKAEWRNKTLAIMTTRLIDQMDLHKTQRNHASAAHLSIPTRVDKGIRTNVRSPKHGPAWGHVARRVTISLGDNQIIQDIEIQDQPIGYNCNAPLPNSATNIRIRFYWEQPEQAVIGQGDTRPRPTRVAFV